MNPNSRKSFEWMVYLQQRQRAMLKDRDDVLLELYKLCDNDRQVELLKDLITRFDFFDEDIYNLALFEIVKYILRLGCSIDEIAIVAFCRDHSADSSLAVLNDIKVPLSKAFGRSIKTINRFDKIVANYNKGIKHFIAVDEFIGSGHTLSNRHKEFINFRLPGATIDYCLVAGMEDAVRIAKDEGINLCVGYTMKKGISGFYSGEKLSHSLEDMCLLENKLAQSIGSLLLDDYRFGYRQSEALYSKRYANVPNNVFPIFWWKRGKQGNDRITLFDRVQDGY